MIIFLCLCLFHHVTITLHFIIAKLILQHSISPTIHNLTQVHGTNTAPFTMQHEYAVQNFQCFDFYAYKDSFRHRDVIELCFNR